MATPLPALTPPCRGGPGWRASPWRVTSIQGASRTTTATAAVVKGGRRRRIRAGLRCTVSTVSPLVIRARQAELAVPATERMRLHLGHRHRSASTSPIQPHCIHAGHRALDRHRRALNGCHGRWSSGLVAAPEQPPAGVPRPTAACTERVRLSHTRCFPSTDARRRSWVQLPPAKHMSPQGPPPRTCAPRAPRPRR